MAADSSTNGLLLFGAVERGDDATVTTLLREGFPVDAPDGDGKVKLYISGFLTDRLLQTALHSAAQKGRISTVALLADKGANVNAADKVRYQIRTTLIFF